MTGPRGLRAVALTVLCAVALLVGSGQAAAHTRLQSSDPADGSTVTTAPERVSLTFNEVMQADFSTLTVVGPDGAAYQTGPVTADGATVSTALLPLGPAGRYELGYRVVSDDGHPVTGRIGFTLTTPGPGAAAAPATAAPADPGSTQGGSPPSDAVVETATARSDGGAPVWPWIVGAALLVLGGVVAALRLGRT